MNIRILLTAFFISLICIQAKAQKEYILTSPDRKAEVKITAGETLTWAVHKEGKILLNASSVGIEVAGKGMLGDQPNVLSGQNNKNNRYHELNLKMKGNYGVIFRAYNEGVAYRFYTFFKGEIEIIAERAEFNFPGDPTVWLPHTTNEKDPFAMAFQNIYSVTPLSEAADKPAFLPVTIATGTEQKITILESDLYSYPGMFLQAEKTTLKGLFAPLPAATAKNSWRAQKYVKERTDSIARVKGTRTYPWRILAITEKDTEMPLNRLVYELAPESRIKDTSWIQPGKCAWEWWNDWGLTGVPFEAGINMETYKYYIDFASQYGLEYVIVDEGWYDPKSGDMMTVISSLDLPELVEYAKSKGVRLILWTVFNVLDEQLEEACSYYSELGIAGFKIDFLDRDDQEAVDMTYRIAEATAKHKLILNLHGYFKPTGIDKTYPHILNFESVFGGEESKWSTIEKDMPLYNVTFPFIRMMAGPVDFTPGAMRNATKRDFHPAYYNPMSQGTRCHQLAMYVVYDSPLTMLCDAPTHYEKEPGYTRFLSSIPVVFDETRILQGKVGEYIVTARRKQDTWYIGGMTNWESRTLAIDLSFLPAGKQYDLTIYQDGPNSGKNATDYEVRNIQQSATGVLEIVMASGGGFVIRITEAVENNSRPGPVPSGLDIASFYEKYMDADGIPIVSSSKVSDEALMRTAVVVRQILSKRNDVKEYMVKKRMQGNDHRRKRRRM
ncbi:MAG: glycoside hydrolase family 97 protein [Tannerellaceae bacterium]|nr:glycoside hydrolase family 97 protein [Tannerellaceae bacterium]